MSGEDWQQLADASVGDSREFLRMYAGTADPRYLELAMGSLLDTLVALRQLTMAQEKPPAGASAEG